MTKICKTLLFLLIFINGLAQSNNLPFRHLTVDDGLPHTDATGILQDEKGFIWISTYAGLNRFDGYEIKTFVSKNYHLQNVYLNRINSVFYQKDKIWLATQGGLAYFDLKTEEINLPKFNVPNNSNFSSVCTFGNQIFGISNGKFYVFKEIESVFTQTKINTQIPFVNSIAIDKKGIVYLGTNQGLFTYQNQKFSAFPLQEKLSSSISFVGFDQQENLLLGFNSGFSVISKNSLLNQNQSIKLNQFTQKTSDIGDIEGQNVNFLVKDFRDDYWICTPNGILRFDSKKQIFHVPFQSNSLSSKHTNSLMIDKSGSLWVSTFGGGVNFMDLTPKLFNTIRFNDHNANYVRAIFEESENGNLWVGTRTEGLIYYNFLSKNYQTLTTKNNLCSNHIRSITKDKAGKLWVGTENGISILTGKSVVKNLKNDARNPQLLTDNAIYSLAVDVFGHVWAGSWHDGLNRIKEENGSFSIYKIHDSDKQISSNKVTFVYADPARPEVLVGTTKGLDHFFLNLDGSIAKVFHYLGRENDPKSMSSNFIWPILRTDANTIWVGTIGGGLNKLTISSPGNYKAEVFDVQNGLPSNDVESLEQDNYGNIWIGGRGLSMLNPKTNQIIKYDANDGLQSNIFKIGASFKGRDGRLYFGGVNGLNYFYPSQIKPSEFVSSIVFSDLLLNNTTAKINENELVESLPYLNKINLNHTQNNLIIKFSSLDYANTEKCLYRYKLIGFNENWVVVNSKNRFVSLSNLDYGEYILQLQSTNHDGVWMEQTKELTIKINPPWWKSVWAKLFYLSIVGLIVYLIYQYQLNWFKLNQKLEIKEIEKRNEEEMHQMRMQFFTNISHELRTPLSLIISPTEKLIYEEIDKENQLRLHQLIQRNATRLLNLVNELLDFRKAESGMMKLKTSEITLQRFLQDICAEFDEVASEKQITFTKSIESQSKLWIDPNILGKIVVNLLSNAFKYTPKSKEIKIEISDSSTLSYKNVYMDGTLNPQLQYKWIKVIDNGIGIDTDSLNHIFERFYRVTEAEKDRLPGSGIGLAFVRSLVLIHKGVIKVSSEPKIGTEFLIGLPLGNAHLDKSEMDVSKDFSLDDSIIKAIETNEFIKGDEILSSNFVESNNAEAKKKNKLLIVEDNDELRSFINDSFSNEFQILLANDGQEGLELAQSELPDLIISDVMMPNMDGLEMCQLIKSNIEISHTPIILLTAKSSDESKISGGEVGADAYITKPFSLKLLQLTVKNILGNRKRLKELYANDIFIEAREMGNTKREKEFIDYLISIVEEHLDDINLDVDLICNQVGMSRTKLYNKIQSLTGQPVGEFIRKIRLKRAAQIIVSEDVNIVEVMERVGIQSQSYFTKAFKKEFGKTPTKFLHDYIVEKEIAKE